MRRSEMPTIRKPTRLKPRKKKQEEKPDKIFVDGDIYDLHVVGVSKKDIANVKNGETLLFVNRGTMNVVALELED